jgi:diguanylate cyclase (GGDEF)-like protein
MQARQTRWWLLWSVAGLSLIAVYAVIPSGGWWSSLIYLSIGASSPVAMVVGIRLHRPSKPVMWYLIAVTQGLWAVGDAFFLWYLRVLGPDATPVLALLCFLVAYPVLATGLFLLIRGRARGHNRAGLLDGGLVATGLTLAVWVFVMHPMATDAEMPVPQRIAHVTLLLGDVLLIVMAARLFTAPGARTASFRLLGGALFFVLCANIGYAVINVLGEYRHNPAEYAYLLGYVMWGAAALHPSMRTLSEPAPHHTVRLTRRRLALLAGASLLAPLILAVQGFLQPTRIDWAPVAGGAAVLFLLVLARMSGLISQVQDQAAQLNALAHNDALTGVPNRRGWDIELVRRLGNARRSHTDMVVAIIDLDHFKRFNDQHGHQAGDRLLKEAAAAWRSQLRADDLLARYGGEEFGVCVSGVGVNGVADLLRRVLAATPQGQTFSAGVACADGTETAEALVGRADAALYGAKEAGRNRVMIHDGHGVGAPDPLELTLSGTRT